MRGVVCAILGGGQGTRLWPLTRDRAKPAVPLGGKFRLIDVPISNSLHAGVEQIYVLTQFMSTSLHRHIAQTYRFDAFRGGFVDILAAQQTMEGRDWYQGTADAIRRNLAPLNEPDPEHVLILSGDQLYLMDVKAFVNRHRECEADLTIAVTPVPRAQAHAFGIMCVDATGRIVRFVEKPKDERTLHELTPDPAAVAALGLDVPAGHVLASMGIYTFRRNVLNEALVGTKAADFGKDVIPGAIHDKRVFAYGYAGYWRDIGTIPSFHEANLDLTHPLPPLNLYSPKFPIYTHPRFLPGTKVNRCQVEQSILCEGSIISESRIANSIVGIRAVVGAGSVIEETVLMGARFYESQAPTSHPIAMGVGENCEIRNAIVDLNARIGDGSRLVNAKGLQEYDGDNFCIRGGVIVVPRDAVIAPGTVV